MQLTGSFRCPHPRGCRGPVTPCRARSRWRSRPASSRGTPICLAAAERRRCPSASSTTCPPICDPLCTCRIVVEAAAAGRTYASGSWVTCQSHRRAGRWVGVSNVHSSPPLTSADHAVPTVGVSLGWVTRYLAALPRLPSALPACAYPGAKRSKKGIFREKACTSGKSRTTEKTCRPGKALPKKQAGKRAVCGNGHGAGAPVTRLVSLCMRNPVLFAGCKPTMSSETPYRPADFLGGARAMLSSYFDGMGGMGGGALIKTAALEAAQRLTDAGV